MASKLVVHGVGGELGAGCSSTVTQLRLGVVMATTGLAVVVVVVVVVGCVGFRVLGTTGLSGRFGFTPAQRSQNNI